MEENVYKDSNPWLFWAGVAYNGVKLGGAIGIAGFAAIAGLDFVFFGMDLSWALSDGLNEGIKAFLFLLFLVLIILGRGGYVKRVWWMNFL